MALRTIPLATLDLVRALGVQNLEVLLLADVTAEGLVLEVLHVHLILRPAAGAAMALEGMPTVRAEGTERASERLGAIIIILRLLEVPILLPFKLGDALLL